MGGLQVRKIILYMQISLDGVVSDPEKWMMTFSDEMLADALKYYDTLDAILVGSKNYPSLADYWKTAEGSSHSALERTFARRINEIRKIVISRSEINLMWNNSEQLMFKDSESLVREIENLRKSEGKNISVESGVKTWQLFLKNSLFDEIFLFVHPVVAGQGKRLFADVGPKVPMQLLDSKVYENGVAELYYRKKV